MSYFIIYWKKNSIAMCGFFFARTDTVVYPFKLHLTMVLKYDEEIKVDSNFHECSVHHIYFQVQNHADNKS